MQKTASQKAINSAVCALSLFSSLSYALSGGHLTHPLTYAAVVHIQIKSDLSDNANCTATKIAPRKYLTAAHCVADNDTGEAAKIERFVISHGNRGKNGFTDSPAVVNVFVNPRWQAYAAPEPLSGQINQARSGSDQAVVEVASDNELPIFELDFDIVREGELLNAAGYGTQNVFPGFAIPPGELRVVTKRADYTFMQPRIIELGVQDSNGETYSQFAPGDSGGPILRVRAGKTMVERKVTVVGVMSYISGLIFIDPDTGKPTAIAKGSAPVSAFLRLEAVTIIGMSGQQNNWLRKVAAQ